MAQAGTSELVDSFEQFFRNYYDNEIKQLAQQYPNEKRSLYVDWQDLYRFDPDLADDFLSQPEQLQRYAEEALRLYDLPIDVSLGQAHVRIRNLPKTESPEIREIRSRDMNSLVEVRGIVRKATDVRPKIEEAAFECQLCGTLTRVPQSSGDFQEPHECQGCERQGPFQVNFDQSEFVDSQKLRIQESPEGLRGGETPQSLDIHVEDDITGEVTPGDHVSAAGVLRLEQQGDGQDKSPVFDFYMEGMSVDIEEEQFEDMDITDEDKKQIYEISNGDDVYERMVGSIAPSIYGYEQEKLAMVLQLFSGVTKQLPDGSRIRGDLHMLLIGDPGTGKCVKGDTKITLADGRTAPIHQLVESNLEDPKPIDDGWWDEIDLEVPSLQDDGSIAPQRATKVWKREAPEQMCRVRTSSGRELEVTPSHPLFVQQDGQFTPIVADDLTEGQFVAAPKNYPTDGDDVLDIDFRRSKSRNAVQLDLPTEWTPSLARLIGYVIVEGYVEQRDDNTGFVSITTNDRAVLNDATNALEELGLNTTERDAHEGKEARELRCSAGELVSFLEALEPYILQSSDEQCVPDDLFKASDPIRSEFLKAFIEGEGHVSASQREITVASMSRGLLEDIRTLLLSVEIRSQLHERRNGSYRLRISASEFEKYVAKIGFVTPRKQKSAERYADTKGNTNLDIVPGVGSELRQIRESLSLTQAECGLPRSTYQHYEQRSRNPSRESLREVIGAFKDALPREKSQAEAGALADGGSVRASIAALEQFVEGDVYWERIESIETVEPDYNWVYDLEIDGTHSYVSNGIVSHNSQMIGYIQNIAPRSVYTSGKGSSSAGLTAAAVRDDFGDGQQWTLEAGALVLADQGIAAVDELDKMRSEDRSAMHEALEQQKISVSKAGINATLKSRCSLLGAANPKYGRFDQYEPIGEQIDLEPALISRFDLIFTVTDQPDEEKDKNLAEHILTTNYAGELTTQQEQMTSLEVDQDEIEQMTEQVDPEIDAELLRKYIAFAKQNCHPRMTDEAQETIRDFYVDLRARGTDEDAAVPVTARKLEALVRLAEASARVRLSDTVEQHDAEQSVEIVRSCLQDIGVDPETGEFDADIVEAGTSKSQRDRIKNLKQLIGDIEEEYDEGAPVDIVLDRAEEIGMDQSKAEHEIDKLKQKGEVYEPSTDNLRTT
ncbi:LAGLIDADG family homing endonuclease [Natronobacterium gregoryi]|uniref:DNA helicase n=2 Tax=Natronobacterium gregoryi TaxID=44930 RepID=L0AHL1_NATGS|nr:LAGLIDADG family homing endonuclease [Natronobacterium gregoryi]AFZ72934.1 putative ATPase involved in replication control, Cdc46/Mcm family [Natronobacterium gregoryi SP2]ELY69918.1 cell division control protein/MCM family protein [Natronobacterium gregoryi SP2]PLK21840.1 cell division protein [Natronobacterium gregoryi SP2]SFI67881.1 replicative DNA helicase Mcm [Natronobacterium gregoryi]